MSNLSPGFGWVHFLFWSLNAWHFGTGNIYAFFSKHLEIGLFCITSLWTEWRGNCFIEPNLSSSISGKEKRLIISHWGESPGRLGPNYSDVITKKLNDNPNHHLREKKYRSQWGLLTVIVAVLKNKTLFCLWKTLVQLTGNKRNLLGPSILQFTYYYILQNMPEERQYIPFMQVGNIYNPFITKSCLKQEPLKIAFLFCIFH